MVPLLKIASRDNGERLDTLLARAYPRYSRAFFQKFMKRGGVTLRGTPREPSYRVRTGESFEVADFENFVPDTRSAKTAVDPVTTIPDILYEDEAMLAIDKPAGLVVHPAPGHRVGTLMDWLRAHIGPKVVKVFTDPERLGLIHRLDKDTSGVLLIAKSIVAQTALSRQFQDRTVKKMYTAFVEGVPSAKSGIINAPVGRSRKVPTRMAILPQGKASETAFEIQEALQEVSQVSLFPKTGRTHQIRVHLSAIGHPIVGDRTYGAKSVWAQSYGVHRPLLHAERLTVKHPLTEKAVQFQAPWPADFRRAQTIFRQAFRALLVISLMSVVTSFSLAAPERTPKKKPASTTSATASRTTARLNELSAEIKDLKQDLAQIRENLADLNAAVDRANATTRLRDLERAVSDLNAKAVSGSGTAEETKTQVLDIGRRLKSQQEALDIMRDQLDRLHQQLIKKQAVDGPAGTESNAP